MSNNSSSGWTEMSFGEMATQISERVDDPQKAGVNIYVGLEHLDPGDLKIRRHGSPSDVEATKLRVRPGQIIFGKRRAYQRKVAVVDFDGICSAHAMVLQEKPSLVPGFLPYFMQSDVFMDRAVTISEGGLSPTIKWKTLAEQKFLVPPPEQQRELVELMQAFDEAIEKSILSILALKAYEIREITNKLKPYDNWRKLRISEVGEARRGRTRSPKRLLGQNTLKYLRALNVKDGYVDFSDILEMDFSFEEEKKDKLIYGDIVMVEGGEARDVGMCSLFPKTDETYCFQDHVIRVRIPENNILHYKFLYYTFKELKRINVFANLSKGTKIKNISHLDVGNLEIFVPTIEEQKYIVIILDHIVGLREKSEAHLGALKKLKANVMNSTISEPKDENVSNGAKI